MEKETESILDLRVLGEMCSMSGRLDDPVLVGLIALFLREESPRVDELGRLARAQDGEELARIAHKLAGSCAVIGALQVYEAAQVLERVADAGSWGEVETQLARVRSSWGLLLAELAKHNLGAKL